MTAIEDPNGTIGGSASAPTLTATSTDCDYCVAVVQNTTEDIIYVGLVAVTQRGTPVTYEIKKLEPHTPPPGSTYADKNIFVAIDDSVTAVRVYTDPTSLSYDPTTGGMTGSNGPAVSLGSSLTVNPTYRQVTLSAVGQSIQSDKTIVYTSTLGFIEIIDDTGIRGLGIAVTIDGVPVTATNGNQYATSGLNDVAVGIIITIPDSPSVSLSSTLYDTNQDTVTVTGAKAWEAQPQLVTDTGSGIIVHNATASDTISAYWLGPTNKQCIDAGADSSPFATSDATSSWYLKWEDPGDPKVIVKRPATLTNQR